LILEIAHNTNLSRDFGLIGASESVQDAFSANIVSLLQAGCFFGALAAAPLGDKLGRRIALALGAISFIVGSIMQVASAGNKPLMFVGRVLGGMVSHQGEPEFSLQNSHRLTANA
jgi:MFS family permease